MVTEDTQWWNKALTPAAQAVKESYTTQMGLAELRLLCDLMVDRAWTPYLYAGGGADIWKLADPTPRRGVGGTKGTAGMVPVGLGLRHKLGERWAFEVSGGYTFVFGDRVDGLDESRYPTRFKDGGKKDNFAAATVGFVYQVPGVAAKAAAAVAAPVVAPVTPARDEAALAKQRAEEEARRKAEAEAARLAEEERVRMARAVEAWVFAPVYFDYDKAVVRDDQKAALTQSAGKLKTGAPARITLAGHCDERGTVEYNLALGQKRASSVREFMVLQGVPADRIRTVSYGKEQPVDPDHTEAAWARNRRVEISVNP
jgi:peptidoglycan-associated lipoprotein